MAINYDADIAAMELSEKQMLAIELSVSGKKCSEIAEELSVTPQTISNWRRNISFKAALNSRLREVRENINAMMFINAQKATQTLVDLLESDSEQIKINAAKTILSLAGNSSFAYCTPSTNPIGPAEPEGVERELNELAQYDEKGYSESYTGVHTPGGWKALL